MYRTGDIARLLSDGTLEFAGRKDNQVKVRGFRIELGEIETVLSNHPLIKQAAVVSEGSETNDDSLSAYLTTKEELSINQLKEYLANQLPEYMIPHRFKVIDKMPLTTSGKIDRKALEDTEFESIDVEEKYQSPTTQLETDLVQVWSEILDVNQIGINDNFFALGGHSLKATQLITKINKELEVEIPLTTIFKSPTVSGLAHYIENNRAVMTRATDDNIVLLKNGLNPEKNIFIIHDGSGEVDGYLALSDHISDEFNCWGIKTEEDIPVDMELEELSQRYLAKIKEIQKTGPYYLLGWSFGGMVAYEIISQLERSDEKIALLAMIDTQPPVKKRKIKKNLLAVAQQLAAVLEDSQERGLGVEELKTMIPNRTLRIIPEVDNISAQKLMKYLKRITLFTRIQALYRPDKKIKTEIHYFKANQSPEMKWKRYSKGKVNTNIISGDHYSIMEKPNVKELAEKINNLLR